MNKNQHG